MPGGSSYLPLDNILTSPAEDMIDNMKEESDEDGETQHANPRSFPKTNTCFQNCELKLRKRII
jgi:hypothetical protein